MRNSLEAFHKSVKPSQWWFFNRYMVPFITYPRISLRFFIKYPADFIVIFHYISCAFHCGFSNVSLGISLWFFNRYPQHFIAEFSNVALGISLWSFKCGSGYFIAHVIWMPGTFNDYFILSSRIFHCSKNSQEMRTKDRNGV